MYRSEAISQNDRCLSKATVQFLALTLLTIASSAHAMTMTLVAHNQRSSSSGILSTMYWAGQNAANPWAVANGVTASMASWDWNPMTGVLTSAGRYETTAHLSSNPNNMAVWDDKVVDLVIDTGNHTTTATSYTCVEGNYLWSVNAHGCAYVDLGVNQVYDSSLTYNVGSNPRCVTLTIGGDDSSLQNGGIAAPRGLSAQTAGQAGAGCGRTSGGVAGGATGAFDLFTIVQDNTATGGQLILSNGVCLTCAGVNYMTFNAVVPLPAAVWLFGSALGVMGAMRRKPLDN